MTVAEMVCAGVKSDKWELRDACELFCTQRRRVGGKIVFTFADRSTLSVPR